MRDTRLIFIEGLPGSGKSTTASILAATLAQRDIGVSCLFEDQVGHPLNVGGTLHPAGATPGAPFFARYTPEAYVEESLQRWQAYVRAVATTDTIQILESYPFQNSVRILLQMGDTIEHIGAYASAVEDLVLPLRPVLVYLDRLDQSGALQSTAEKRGTDWADYVAKLITDSPVGQHRGLQGIAGVLAFMCDYQSVVEKLLGESQLSRLVLTDCAGRWEDCHQQILAFLEI